MVTICDMFECSSLEHLRCGGMKVVFFILVFYFVFYFFYHFPLLHIKRRTNLINVDNTWGI